MNSETKLPNTAQADQQMVDMAQVAKITRQLYEREQFAYILLDPAWHVVDVSDNFVDYGFPVLQKGNDVRDSIDFLVGLENDSTLDLPILMSPSNHPLHIVLLPEDECLTVVLMDANRAYEQKQMVQQKANENELLLERQRLLTQNLKMTQEALLSKNKQLQDASRLQSSFMSGVSHEFRTPLSALLGYVDILIKHLTKQTQEETMEQLTVVRRSARHLLSLVENLLDHGRLDADEMVFNPKPVNLTSLCDDVESMLSPTAITKKIGLEFDVKTARNQQYMLDDSRLRQILINIVGNAIKFTHHGQVYVSVSWLDNQLHVRVRDSGIGISKENLQEILKPFWQVDGGSQTGTGLGLTITERIIDMMGGSMIISSQLGEGTEVTISLPAAEADSSMGDFEDGSGRSLDSLRFLLAEDDPDIAMLVQLLLEQQGVDVIHVENGQQAVKAVSNNQFDLILMDLQMPLLDGYAATKQIRALGCATPILVMTASAIEADRSKAEQAGCDGYLVKPVAINEVMSLADELLLSHAS